jgi:cyclase
MPRDLLSGHTIFAHDRDMLTTVRECVRKLKTSGRSLQDTLAAKPSADLDPTWGKGFMQPNGFVTLVYNTV